MYITLEQAKKQLLVDDSTTEEDEIITRCINAAEQVVAKSLCKPLDSFLLEDGILKEDVAYAILLMVSNFYNNRDAVSFSKAEKMPFGFDFLIALNKDYSK